MAGSQGSSYGSSKGAAAGNAKTTANLKAGNNASGSAKSTSSAPAKASVNAAAANAARMAASRAVSTSSNGRGGYGASQPASASVNAAAARASMMNNQRMAGDTQSAPGKGNAYGANQVVSKGVNLSAGDMLRGGYGAYKNPSAGLAMAARPNTTVAQKGVNLSSGDMLAGGYGKYQQAPSQQSTPQAAAGGWNALAGLQAAVAPAMNPSFGNLIAGTMRGPYGKQLSTGEIGTANPEQALVNAGYGPQPSQIARINYGQQPMVKDPSRVMPVSESYWANKEQLPAARYAEIAQGQQPPSINSVPNLPNYSAPVSVAAREPVGYGGQPQQQQQAAGYQNPARAFPNMAPQQQPTQRPAFVQGLLDKGFTGSPAPAGGSPEYAFNAIRPYAPGDNTFNQKPTAQGPGDLYGGDSTPQQKAGAWGETQFEKIVDPALKLGEAANGLMGGSPYNDLYGRPNMSNPNARGPLNNLPPKDQEQVVAEAGKAATSPAFNALPPADQAKVLELIKTGMTLEQAIAALNAGTTPGTQPPKPSLMYPDYYSKWANLPKGQYA